MTYEETQTKIIAFVESALSVSGVKETDLFIEDLGGDELDGVEFIMDIEDHFNIFITEREAEQLKTIKDFIDCTHSKITKQVDERNGVS